MEILIPEWLAWKLGIMSRNGRLTGSTGTLYGIPYRVVDCASVEIIKDGVTYDWLNVNSRDPDPTSKLLHAANTLRTLQTALAIEELTDYPGAGCSPAPHSGTCTTRPSMD